MLYISGVRNEMVKKTIEIGLDSPSSLFHHAKLIVVRNNGPCTMFRFIVTNNGQQFEKYQS